jgi:hypothetical protein
MKWDELRELCGHWRKRQEEGLAIFRFKSALKNHMREDHSITRRRGVGKNARAYVEIDEPEGSRMAHVREKKAKALEKARNMVVDTESEHENTSSDGEGSEV